MSAKTKIFIRAEKVPILKFPLMTLAILVFDKFTARTVSCSDGSSSSLSWSSAAVCFPKREMSEPVSMSMFMFIPFSWPVRLKSFLNGTVNFCSGRVAMYVVGERYMLLGW